MKSVVLFLIFLLNSWASAQDILESGAVKWSIPYDSQVLRIPGNDFRIGISERNPNGTYNQTRGFLNGKVNWKKFRVEVEGAVFHKGKIKIPESKTYNKDKGITIKVYHTNSSILLVSRHITFNYEKGVKFLTDGNIGKVPGSIVKYGFRIYYDNGKQQEFYPPKYRRRLNIFRIDSSEIMHRTVLEQPLDKFLISSDGGYFLKRYLVIENDPFKIKYHTARFFVSLANNPSIFDEMEIELDYIDNYTFDSRFVRNYCLSANTDNEDRISNSITYSSDYYGDQGHDLEVYADVYKDSFFKDSLLLVVVSDLNNCEHYNYLINTNGGSIQIFSRGMHGSDGSAGRNGNDGSKGTDGTMGSSGAVTTKYITDSNGKVTTITETGPGGNGGNGSNGGDGERGSDGENGSNGGNGGDIYVRYPHAVIPYLHLIDISSIPGKGGSGGSSGDGGRGGKGGSGGMGGPGNPNGSNGSAGNNGSDGADGRDGLDGNTGKAGMIIKRLIK